MATLVQNVRFGLRMLIKQPTTSAISVLALALGIGLTTTMYSIVHGALTELPFEDAHEIVALDRTNPSLGIDQMAVSQHDYVDWAAQQTSFEQFGAYYQGTINVSGSERPLRFDGAFMTPSIFPLIGAAPALGRALMPEDARPGADPALLIGHEVWENQFQSDPAVVGAAVRINGRPGTIVGVMPPGFGFPMAEEAWLPLAIDLAALDGRGTGTGLAAVGRLRDGISIEAALEEMDGIASRIAADHPDTNEGVRAIVRPFTRRYLNEPVVVMLWTMQGAVFMVLLIACANVANLLLARAIDRSKEVAVRTALGAGRWRVISQFLTEVLVLASIGGALGLIVAKVGVVMFNSALAGVQKPYRIQVDIDWVVLAFTSAVVVIASLVAGLVPALQVSGSNLSDVLKDESRGSSGFRMGRLSRVLVVAEVALSCGLLVGAGLMIKSVAQLSNLDLGFRTDVLTARVGLFAADYPEVEQRRQFFADLQRRLDGLPGARGAVVTQALPGSQQSGSSRFAVEGESYPNREDYPRASAVITGPGLFDTFEARLLQGRDFNQLDTAESLPVAIVNTSFAERFYAGQDALGRRFRLGSDPDTNDPWLTIVGVAPDLQMPGVGDLGDRGPEGVYLALAQNDLNFASLAVLTADEPLSQAGAVRQAVSALDPDLPIYWVQTLQTQIEADTWFFRVFGSLFMVFGFVALFLASIGLYGVMSFAVRRRTAEVGIRMALGANSGHVLGLVLRQGLWQIAFGLVLGLGLAMLAAGGLELVLFQVDPRDVSIYALITLVLAVTGLLACLLPAARAARIDPNSALRA